MVLKPDILLISSTHDYSTDYVTYELNKRDVSYLRLNRDQFCEYQLCLSPIDQVLKGVCEDLKFEIKGVNLKSIYFRAPVFLNESYNQKLSPDEQLGRSQWSAFLRALTIFENVLWVNHPKDTFQAEIKPYQLLQASKLGFNIPGTIVSNCLTEEFDFKMLAVKTLASNVYNIGEKEAFIYTTFAERAEIEVSDLSAAPVILQEPLIPKIDLRVTVIGNFVCAVSITKAGKGIDVDWRLEKENVTYEIYDLPVDLKQRCVDLVKSLSLSYGAIDLVVCGNEYYFLEINPTGEWSWLQKQIGFSLDEKIAELLLGL